MSKERILRQVTLDRASRKKDKSVSITFVTSLEQSSDQFKEIDELLDTHGVIYYKSNGDLTSSEIDELDSVDLEIEGKTKSQRLRNVLYVFWKDNFEHETTFKDFYSKKMEELIEHFKNKLD